ncbi:leucine-rich repeat-containing protein 43-like isoform X7 [Phycodurus eques]|uniref:leucine-rich repeat-containing protein 43-like isoform X7 n=1 Tax=Phycodurus eques TaxID=693459 RepID=UPI002ACD2B19|nr:leucine-rich repeat-containing protein 43-like isoform X7 [Phycodurus eques]
MESSFSLRGSSQRVILFHRKGSGAEAEAMTEDTDTLLDLLSCPHSPWHHDEPWSPQAAALQRVAVVEPERLDADFVCSYFRKLRIVDKDVSVIDNFLLKFCNLQELVLSANRICEISADNLPRTLKVLELRANQLCALGRLAISPPPRLQYLGLAANHLGSHRDVTQLTGRQWPELVCLDLSECDFGEQRPLLKALGTLPCLRTLVLEGNPFTLAPSYPGFAVDALPRLSYLDAAWIAPEERHRYRGMARMSQSRHSTSSQPWADCVDFDDALTFVVRDLSGFKKFLHRGFRVFIEQEKILSWPAEASDEAGQGGVDKKGKQAKVKDKRKKAVVELVADPPIATVVASSHVSLQGLLYRHQKVDVLCDFGCLHKDPPKEDTPIMDENIIMDNKAKDESKKKGGGAGGVRAGNKKPPTTKGVPNVLCTMKMSRACYTTVLLLLLLQGTRRGKGSEERDAATPTQAETATVELSVELKKWRHASKVAPLTPANL